VLLGGWARGEVKKKKRKDKKNPKPPGSYRVKKRRTEC